MGAGMATLKQRVGAWLIPRLPVNPWVFRTFRVELNAMIVRLLNSIHPGRIMRLRALRAQQGVLVNVGCGPFGKDGWINLDLFPAPGVTMRVDCRRALPLGDGAARGIHVEHYFEHLEPTLERPRFLAECRRCLEPGGVLRIVVPDVRKYVEAYLASDWTMLNHIGCGGELPQATFATKMEALNHVFVQDGEHYGGFDAEYLRRTLEQAGFADVAQVDWREGSFPGGAIDREQHRLYSLYVEARR
jgi:predicted SAM-dependent methyltransferase